MVGLTFGLIAGLSFGLIEGLFAGLIVGMFFGMIGGLVVGSFFALLDGLFVGKSPLQNLMKHYTLREILVRNKHLPRKLIKFLDYATERKILVRVGGGYRFIHALLQDYIADLETESPA